MIKALGTFGYQVGVLGRQRYRSAIPRTLRRLQERLPTFETGAVIDRELRKLDLYGPLSKAGHPEER
jgi:hypothetical protein